MSEPIHSSGWTGPLGAQSGVQRGAFTHRIGEPNASSDYQRLLWLREAAAAIPVEVRRVMGLAAIVFLASPATLMFAWFFLHAVVPDIFANDNRAWLIAWGAIVMAIAATQMVSRSTRALFLRKSFLTLLLIATAGFSIAYATLGVTAYGGASASTPERTFQLRRSCGRYCSYNVHQRADGSTVEGMPIGTAVAHGTVCARVQRFDGEYGFSWVRVLERSPAPTRGQLGWPIRREDCFGTKPVSSLRG